VNYCTTILDHITVQTTGGKLLDNDFIKRITEPQKITFEIPLYGPSADIHDEVTGVKGTYSDTISLIRESPLNIKVHTIILKKNIVYLKQIKEICEQHGRNHSFLVLYASTDDELYNENAPMLTEIIKEVIGLSNEGEYTDFIRHNTRRLTPCIVKGEYIKEEIEVSYTNLEGENIGCALWDEKNPNLIACRYRERCSAGQSCPGIYKAYTELYSWGEFKPI
jgi:MoaA/NifB/PqqE/SkfB family radical SAM enzyme